MIISRKLMFLYIVLLSGYILWGQPQPKSTFVLSIEQANPGKFHVEFYYEGITSEVQDF